ncbi:hypothetical protein E2C01_034810 [Portunus trituberculatus]|uniref:Uncharacterized protein n=1 Tax=Portunus trituberculatus TaxID=210409 RepID=A0A5B7F802_PORTR|nr:hypothetical protein [Portunus trituberculatus]
MDDSGRPILPTREASVTNNSARMTESPRSRHQLTVLSANVCGFCTNIGDLTHSFALRHHVDIAVATETWLK